MAAQKGKDLLLKLSNNGTNFSTVAGLRSRSITINAETVDVTSQESANQWRELLDGAGQRHARITGSGIFKDASSDADVRSFAFQGSIKFWQIVVPDFGTIQGLFQITNLEFSGRHDGEVTFDLTLESARELTFTAL